MTDPAVARFGAALAELERELDWTLLGRLHCEGDGSDFFSPEQRRTILDCGLLFADDLGRVLRPGGRSLYVGASVAELAPILCEALVLGRTVEWNELPGPVSAELARALAAVSARLGCALPRPSTAALEAAGPACDHLWLVSVLTDPEHFPALHDRLYERTGRDATNCGDAETERTRAAALVERALARLAPPAWISTTDEELAFVEPACARHGWRLEVPERARLSGVVGDAVRLCRVELR